jgi:hypothetical protein
MELGPVFLAPRPGGLSCLVPVLAGPKIYTVAGLVKSHLSAVAGGGGQPPPQTAPGCTRSWPPRQRARHR